MLIADESKKVTIRGTSFFNNLGSGANIAGSVGAVSNVDLGTITAPGANVFGNDADANLLAGFCNNGVASVNARGNLWSSYPPPASTACSGNCGRRKPSGKCLRMLVALKHPAYRA